MFLHLRLGLPRGFFPIVLPVKILKTLLPYSILAILPAHLNLLDLITTTILGATVQTMRFLIVKPSSLPILIQIFASGSYLRIPLACVNIYIYTYTR